MWNLKTNNKNPEITYTENRLVNMGEVRQTIQTSIYKIK